ncbi:MAG TPA: hypothetical protein VEJ18_10280, partial [Planctomycetota bacterium]|nr:hypothetical protein [Planctomycetota bacterium]
MQIVVALLLQAAVEVPAPAGADLSKPFRVVTADGTEVPAQAHGRSVVVLTSGGELRLEASAPRDFPKVGVQDDGKA